jgi:hypothetical protein
MSPADTASLHKWDVLYQIAMWAVAVGVALEGSEMVARWYGKFKPSIEESRKATQWIHIVADTGFLLLVAGLFIENISHTKMSAITAREQNRLVRELGEATTNAGKAIKDAASANRQTEIEKKERLKLEELISPRSLTFEQQKEMLPLLVKFKDAHIVVTSYSLDVEGLAIATQLINLFTKARLNVIDKRNTENALGGGLQVGIHVYGDNKELAELIVNGLQKANQDATVIPTPRQGGVRFNKPAPALPNSVYVMVGVKPFTIKDIVQ